MGERASKRPAFRVGQVVTHHGTNASLLLLVERFHATWPTWESEGRFWQWRHVCIETGTVACSLENALEHWHVAG
jgi:hypothetical protein